MDYDEDNIYSPSFLPYVMKVERQPDGTFFVWIAGELGYSHVTRKGVERLRDNPTSSRHLKGELDAALAD